MITRFLKAAATYAAVVALAVFGTLLALTGVASADSLGDTVITVPPLWLPFVVGVVTPLLAGLAIAPSDAPPTKAIIGLLCVALATLVQAVLAGGVTVNQAAILFITTFGTHVITYLGIWKPAGGGDGAPTIHLGRTGHPVT